MLTKILQNAAQYKITESNLPCLITYGEGMGGSHFSITLTTQLFASGSKILFLTAYPMAREDFLEQVGLDHTRVDFVRSVDELIEASSAQAIILESGNEALFLEAINHLPDIAERVIFVKNIEFFSEAVFTASTIFPKQIFSGNIDACGYKEKIATRQWKTIVAFNQPALDIGIVVPQLEKYNSFLVTTD
jgi:hypothetical protein